MNETAFRTSRVFKTAWFSKAALKARIKDDALCEAIKQVAKGQGDDLSGGVFKKRLNKNQHRAIIIIARAGRHWMYEYLFAKKDRKNIEDNELAALRNLARIYAGLTDPQIERLRADGDIMEICNDSENQV